MDNRYFGAYETFETPSSKEGGALMGSDNLVGDRYSLDFEMEGGAHRAWVVNRFGRRIGFFDAQASRRLQLQRARGLKLVALLSYVGFRREGKAGSYFGECAVMGYHPAYEEPFSRFLDGVGSRLGDGVRPQVDLGEEGAARIIETEGEWQPKQVLGAPQLPEGSVVMKQRRSLADKAVEQGRAGNKGCYAVSILFIVAALGAVALGVAACAGALPPL